MVTGNNTPTNLSAVNLNAYIDRNINQYFNNFFDIPVEVSSNIDSAIISYFETITDNKEAARALASAVLYTSVRQGADPMSTLKEFQKLPPGDLDAYTTAFLNLSRVGTSYLGVNTQPTMNKYIKRSILF